MTSHKPLYLLSLIIVIFASTFTHAFAQNTIRGSVFDASNGEAVPFANLMIEGSKSGALSDINGFFTISAVPNGTQILRVRCVGYQDYVDTLHLNHQTVKLNIQLKIASTVIDEVVISSSRTEEQRVQTNVSVEKITASQIQQMPSIGGQSDIAQYMQVLPGVTSTGDQGGQLYIRGGSMIQNLCLLDGMIVYNPFHSIGLYSIFETDIIHNADIFTGGFGAEYGGRLSSVMDIKTRDGNKKRHSGKIGFNTFGANLVLEGPLMREKNGKTTTITYLLSAKESYLSKTSPIFYSNIDGGLPFDFLDLYGKLTINSGTGSKASLFGFRFDDEVLGYHSIADYHWRNVGAGGNFVLVTGSSANIEGIVAYSDYNISLSDQTNKPKSSGIRGFNMGLSINSFHSNSNLKFGLNLEGYTTEYIFTNAYNISQEQNENTTQLSAYGTYHLQSGKFLFDPGLRFVYYASLNEGSIEPRLALKHNTTDRLRLKLAAGIYSQILLDARSDNDVVNLFNGFLTGSGYLNMPTIYQGEPVNSCIQRAQHLVIGVEYDLARRLSLNVETYLKNFSHLLNMNSHQLYDRHDPAYQIGGVYEKPQYFLTDFVIEKGLASGLDVSLCYDAERLYVWATYSLGYVQRTDEVQTYNPHYDRRHTINLMATYSLGSQKQWELSGRWSFGSGYPFTQTYGVYENLNFNNSIEHDYWNENGTFGVQYGQLYGSRLPAYHRLDLSVKRKFSIGAHGILELNLGATNIYSRQNIFYIDRMVASNRINQLPFMANFGINFSF